jgi:hypothetical protein
LQCTDKCTCRDCGNRKENQIPLKQEPSDPMLPGACSPMHEQSHAV